MTCHEFMHTTALHPASVTRATVAAHILHRRKCKECREWLEQITNKTSRADNATVEQIIAVENDSECREMLYGSEQ